MLFCSFFFCFFFCLPPSPLPRLLRFLSISRQLCAPPWNRFFSTGEGRGELQDLPEGPPLGHPRRRHHGLLQGVREDRERGAAEEPRRTIERHGLRRVRQRRRRRQGRGDGRAGDRRAVVEDHDVVREAEPREERRGQDEAGGVHHGLYWQPFVVHRRGACRATVLYVVPVFLFWIVQ